MAEYPKRIKRNLRDLTRLAYERELSRELGKLSQSFDGWRAGQLDPFALVEQIHRFHNGPARELHSRYNDSGPRIELLVAYALREGLLKEEEVPDEVQPYLVNARAFYEAISHS